MSEQYDIFISYRRSSSGFLPRAVRDSLTIRGYSVFLDVESMRAGGFDRQLLETIRGCKDFILVLSPGALDRCGSEEDWLRQELSCALAEKKNIIPLIMDGFDSFPEHLPEDIAAVKRLHSLRVFQEYYDAMIGKLCDFLCAQPRGAAASTESQAASDAAPAAPAESEAAPAAPAESEAAPAESDFVIENGILVAYTGSAAAVTVPAGVTAIGRRAFFENKTVRRVVLPEGVTEIQGSSIFDKEPGGAFRRSALEEIVLPQSLQKIGDCVFADSALLSVELPAGLRQIGDFAFAGTKLESITLPPQIIWVSNFCFNLCSRLKTVHLPAGIRTLGGSAFALSRLEEIEIPESVTEIGGSCFRRCVALREITLPGRLTKLRDRAFLDCGSLVRVTVPAALPEIPQLAFSGCPKLETVVLSAQTKIAADAFQGSPNVRLEYIG